MKVIIVLFLGVGLFSVLSSPAESAINREQLVSYTAKLSEITLVLKLNIEAYTRRGVDADTLRVKFEALEKDLASTTRKAKMAESEYSSSRELTPSLLFITRGLREVIKGLQELAPALENAAEGDVPTPAPPRQ